jgi:hypothetical protein
VGPQLEVGEKGKIGALKLTQWLLGESTA